ncbi:MAG: hypothetical protein ACE5JN_08315 [Candidatus Methylomirabilia bacterium]
MELIGTIVVLLLVGPVLLFWAVGLLLLVASLFPTTLRPTETFSCPVTGRVVTAEFLVREGAAHPSEVVSCTAFPNPEEVSCEKRCREVAEARWGLSRIFPRWALIADGFVTWRSVGPEGSDLAASASRDDRNHLDAPSTRSPILREGVQSGPAA